MYAIIQTGGKQYRVAENDTIRVERLDVETGDKVNLEVIMISNDGSVVCGKKVAKATVTAEVMGQDKAKKIIVYKYKAKKNVRSRQGHRQPFTMLKITAINA